MRRHVVLVSVVLLWMGCQSSWASTYVVSPDGSGDYPTIQAAVDAAVPGDVVALTNGIFTGDGNRNVDFLGKAITVMSQSGNADACVLDCEGSQTLNRRGFIFHSGEGSDSVLEEITIRHGYCSRGGGVLCAGGSPRIIACLLELNSASENGGGLDCESGSAPQVESCVFSGNWSEANGGGGDCYQCAPTFSQCVFSGNRSRWEGGGLSCHYEGNPTLIGCVFRDNSTDAWGGGGGGLYCLDSAPVLSDCSFIDNTSRGLTGEGGGVRLYQEANAVFTRCVFGGNMSDQHGGGISAHRSSFVLVDCVVYKNIGQGGGGGFSVDRGSLSLIGCTIDGNSAENGSGILCLGDGQVELSRTVVAFGVGGEAVRCEDTATATLSCCDLYANEGGDWVGPISGQFGISGNISADPLFCSVEDDDFTLHANSPCAPDSNPECGLIGAWPVGCSSTPVGATTWGAIKAMFR